MDKGDTDREQLIDGICDAFGHLFDALDVMAGDEPGTTWEDRSHVQQEDTAGRERRAAARTIIAETIADALWGPNYPHVERYLTRADHCLSRLDALTPPDAASAAAGSVMSKPRPERDVNVPTDDELAERDAAFQREIDEERERIRQRIAAAESAETSGEET